jgi:hypothetical protein
MKRAVVMAVAVVVLAGCIGREQELSTPGSTVPADSGTEVIGIDAPQPVNQEIVGQWVDDREYFRCRIVIYVTGDAVLLIDRTFEDGSVLTQELIDTESPEGRRFDLAEGSSHGDHWVLTSDGLESRDDEGWIATAASVD